uniref:VanZ-like domain-containing protein n=1 Tax=viral metagenome TaxID=1070528 RepID=A0A6C0JUX7_9ZZZZ
MFINKNLILIAILFICFYYSIVIVPKIYKLGKFHKTCIISNDNIDVKTRGYNYFINDPNNSILNQCLVTQWNLIHVILFTFLTTFYPHYYIHFFIGGVLFEIFEYMFYDCEDYLDPIYNGIGIFLGLQISKLL